MKSSKKKQIKPQGSEIREVDVVPRRDAPAADREIETLLEQARKHLDESKRLKGESFALGRRSVKEFYAAGSILATIREKLKPTQHSWVAWQEENKLSRNRVNLAIRLFEAVRDPADLEKFKAIRQALRAYGIEKERAVESPVEPPTGMTDRTQPVEADAATGGNKNDEAGVKGGHEDDEDQDQPPAPKDEKQPPAPSQGMPVPCVQGKLQVERSGTQTSIVVEAGKVRVDRVLPFKCGVRIVARWQVELRRAIDNGEAVLVLPGVEVPEDAR